jgi:hypothetical protein
MIGEVFVTDNIEEIEKAEELGFEAPEPVYRKTEILFDIEGVYYAYINVDGNININIHQNVYTLDFNKEIWGQLKEKFA